MIVFGTKAYARVLATLMLVCQRCGNPAAHHVIERVVRFTLFFIPLFPVSAKRSLSCTFCGQVTPVSKEQAEQFVAQAHAEAAPATQAGPWPPSVGPAGQPVQAHGLPPQNYQH